MADRILVFVPMYNCAPQITRVLQSFENASNATPFAGLICVDNRSTDDTQHAARTALPKIAVPNWALLENVENYGLGGSHKVAIRYGLENGYSHLVVLHGDDQGSVTDILPLIAQGVHRQVDCLLGARFMKGSRLVGYSWLRTAANEVFNRIFSLAAKQRLFDLGSGLNMYRLSIFRDGFHHRFADDLTFNYYMILATARRGLSHRFFPLTWREEDQVSNAKLFRQGRRMLVMLRRMFTAPEAFLADEHRAKPREAYDFRVVASKDAEEAGKRPWLG